ncbi:MAG TPA: RlmE family RNA methyltransferase [Polyangia bacterium]|jgi:23S rRNA (uridine2552-2'-O)-methyltransferase|nr:RlmE family RNA methyltransferase [Polyangia bacterium]
MSKLRDPRHRHDVFFKRARDAGFVARSIYKLEEIDKRLRLLRRGQRVLDLGCRPGSWLQYAVGAVGPQGAVVGIDRDALPHAIPGARVITGDIFAVTDTELLADLRAFDVVLSDMAPDTTGVRATDQARSASLFEEALGRALRLLAPAGAFVGKIFQGPDFEAIRRRMTARFAEVRVLKPESSRAQSIEIYLCGKGFLPASGSKP